MSQPYTIKNGNEALTSHSGLALIGALLNQRTHLKERLNTVTLSGCVSPKITHADRVFSMLGLISLAKPDYDVIEPFRADVFFKNSLSLDACPSSSALRQQLALPFMPKNYTCHLVAIVIGPMFGKIFTNVFWFLLN